MLPLSLNLSLLVSLSLCGCVDVCAFVRVFIPRTHLCFTQVKAIAELYEAELVERSMLLPSGEGGGGGGGGSGGGGNAAVAI